MADLQVSLGVAIALLALGALAGHRWARWRPQASKEGHRERPHYLLGLNYVVSHEPHHAIRELSRAVREETDAIEAYLALGNLFRENGQTERAIDIHKSLLHRPGLSEWERVQVLMSLGMDFKRAGLIDRAERTFHEISQRDGDHLGSLHGLQRIYEETGRWDLAVATHERILAASDGAERDLLPALHSEWGRSLLPEDVDAAEEHFREALELSPEFAAARLGLARCLAARGDDAGSRHQLERAIAAGPPWALAALEPLEDLCVRLGDQEPLRRACEAVIERDGKAWRAHLALARIALDEKDLEGARRALARALSERPGSPAVQRDLWRLLQARGEGFQEFLRVLEGAIDDARLADPFVCLECRFRSVELFARCPHCHEWTTMTEERH